MWKAKRLRSTLELDGQKYSSATVGCGVLIEIKHCIFFRHVKSSVSPLPTNCFATSYAIVSKFDDSTGQAAQALSNIQLILQSPYRFTRFTSCGVYKTLRIRYCNYIKVATRRILLYSKCISGCIDGQTSVAKYFV